MTDDHAKLAAQVDSAVATNDAVGNATYGEERWARVKRASDRRDAAVTAHWAARAVMFASLGVLALAGAVLAVVLAVVVAVRFG